MGVARSFPTTTSMIVEGGRCAAVGWVPITEHTETTTECAGASGGLSVPRLVTNESIAGSDTTSTVVCPSTAYRLPPPLPPAARQTWAATCSLRNPAEKVLLAGEELGQSTMTVGDQAVTVEHSRFTLTFDGSQAGTNPTDFWIVPSSGLIVQEKEEVGVTSGGVRYSENMLTTLTSLNPAR